ncbi:ribonuclease P protein component [Candidatus Wolfebacteria bacterium]|nr:ribonuclease P protein component [Candidatus Wolfebacteria bacterium]
MYNTPHLILRALPGKRTASAFVVPKHLNCSAVERNTLRRRGYAALGERLATVETPHTLVFLFKRGAKTLSTRVLGDEIQTLLDKATPKEYNTP